MRQSEDRRTRGQGGLKAHARQHEHASLLPVPDRALVVVLRAMSQELGARHRSRVLEYTKVPVGCAVFAVQLHQMQKHHRRGERIAQQSSSSFFSPTPAQPMPLQAL